MDDVERRLRTLLCEASPVPLVPAGMVRAAAGRAGRIRRRRTAAGGALGAVAVVTGGVALAQAAGEPRQRLAPVGPPAAQASATAPAPTASPGVRVVRVPECRLGTERLADRHCEQTTVLELVRSNSVDRYRSVDRYEVVTDGLAALDPDRSPTPAELVVEYADGAVRRFTARSEGAGRWFFDVALPPAAEVLVLTVRDRAGNAMLVVRSQEPGEKP